MLVTYNGAKYSRHKEKLLENGRRRKQSVIYYMNDAVLRANIRSDYCTEEIDLNARRD